MTSRGQIGIAVVASVAGHLLLAGGATAYLAFKRASPPANDAFRAAYTMRSNWDVSATGDSFYATREPGEPFHAGTKAGGSVWWRWRAPEDASVEVLVAGHEFDEVVAIYRGAVIDTLIEVAGRGAVESDGVQPVSFVAEADTEYLIAVAGSAEDQFGPIELRIVADPEVDPVSPEEFVLQLPDLFTIEEVEEEPAEEATPFLRTEHNEPAAETPDDPKFESDRNTLAASELPPDPDGEEDMITQDGEDFPWAQLVQDEFTDGEFDVADALQIAPQWAPAEAAVEPVDSPVEAELLTEVPEIDPSAFQSEGVEAPEEWRGQDETEAAAVEELAEASVLEEIATEPSSEFLASEKAEQTVDSNVLEPPPEWIDVADVESRPELREDLPVPEQEVAEVVPPTPEPQPEAASPPKFRTESAKRRTVGKLSNLGVSALDAEQTPLGIYKQKIDRAIQRSWHRARVERGDFATFGSMKVRFWVNREGRVVNVKVVRHDANAVMVDFSIAGIKRADIPPMPDEIYEKTQDGLLDMDYDIIIY